MHRYNLVMLMTAVVSVSTACAQQKHGTPAISELVQARYDTQRGNVRMVPDTAIAPVNRDTILERELASLKSLRISGYVQTEWQHFDQTSSAGGRALFSDARKNVFTIRRGRIKFQHKLGSVMSYTIQPDITEAGVSIKDAFISLNLLDDSALRLDAGMFNRPNFEVELSSSARESAERSQVVRAFYPGERDLGVMLASRLRIAQRFDPQLQLGVFNGPGTRPEIDALKDIIARIVLPVPFEENGPLQASIGASFYYGGVSQRADSLYVWENDMRATVANDQTGGMAGMGNNRHVGVEAQIELDVLPFGHTIARAEFLDGQRATPGSAATAASTGITTTSDGRDSIRIVPGTPAGAMAIRRQMGYYLYLVQNIGDDLQIVAKYDSFDRNTDVASTAVTSSSESSASILGLGLNYFWENIRVTLYYEMPAFARDEAIQLSSGRPIDALRNDDVRDNKTTLRLQYKF